MNFLTKFYFFFFNRNLYKYQQSTTNKYNKFGVKEILGHFRLESQQKYVVYLI